MPINLLAIDDDTATTELLSIILKMHGFEFHAANSGEEGIQSIRDQPPNIVLLDLMMPGLDGWQVCKTVRTFSDVPIIILSALDSPGMVASALDDGADDYLIKPVPINVLVAHLKRLIRRTGQLNKETGINTSQVTWIPDSKPVPS
jgi:DNA-binding response OmpR family regulator